MKVVLHGGDAPSPATGMFESHDHRRGFTSKRLRKSVVGAGVSAVLSLVLTMLQPGGAPPAAAGPDAQCQDPAYTTAIVSPTSGQWENTAVVACVPVTDVGHDCHAPLGAPHTLLYPRGQGPEPACHSIYGPH